jgi:hypothetical protein
MNKPIDFEAIQHRKALDVWLADCRKRMDLRFPKIDFDSDHWPIKTLYQTESQDWHFTEPFADFAAKDVSYRETLRCLVSEMAIAGKPKKMHNPVSAFRLLANARPHHIFDLTLQDARQIESDCLAKGRDNPASADMISSRLSRLAKQLSLLSLKGVIPRLGFYPRAETKAELRKLDVAQRARRRAGVGDVLDRKMEAFNEAFNGLLDDPVKNGSSILSPLGRVVICMMGLSLCAPSRINEILCMSIDDFVTIDNYAQRAIGERDAVYGAHQMLIVTMKGSKGAEWSPKPVLSFMMDVFHYCMDLIKENGKRSRMLVEWHQKHPDSLYLPPELEYLRGRDLRPCDVAKVMYLTETPKRNGLESPARKVFTTLNGRRFKAPNPDTHKVDGKRDSQTNIDFLRWADVEQLLLKNVHQAMDNCRRVTPMNHYEGDLSKMLFFFDSDRTPYLPHAINYLSINKRLKKSKPGRENYDNPPFIFEKLNITMPVNGKVQFAEMDTHDPRRWLTTMALTHGEKLSDVLINKWANRCNLSQLKAYDFRTAETMAAAAAMPDAPKLTELTDLSNGLAAIEKLEDQFGLQTTIATAHDAGIAVTSMNAITEAIENRPVANSSRGIIVIYPQRFGACLHQHHEKPCRNYSNDLELSCITCNEGVHTKGHIPTNDETRKVDKKLFNNIVRHLENLALTHNRNVADDPAALGEHMLTLVYKGLSHLSLEQLAAHLIEDFHKSNHLLKDRLLARRLEQAFVARGVVKLLDDPTMPNGALIKYHNPTRHSEPLMEIALDEHGGREQVERDEQALIARYPQFASKALGLIDERHLIAPDDNEGED